MIIMTHRVAGEETVIRYPQSEGDVQGFREFIYSMRGEILALDTETTGLYPWARGFKCRLVQFGNGREAWVLDAEKFRGPIREVLDDPSNRYVLHNAPFDALVLDRVGLARMVDILPRMYDTYILAHLIDPRTIGDGGPGLKLKEITAHYVDPNAEDTAKGLYKVFRSEYKATKETGWALIDIDHPLYVRYAGLDVIYAARVLRELSILVRQRGMSDLARFEHDVQRITTGMQKRGQLIDVEYTEGLVKSLEREAEEYRGVAAEFGVDNVNATRQVTAGLLGMGEEWRDKTATGALSVGKETLLPLADLDKDWHRIGAREPNPLADAVVRAKRAKAWGGTYGQAFLDMRDEGDRIHPNINALAARTARMAISSPPLQQLPSSDWTIRRCIVADPGKIIVAADYAQVEMRVLAALADIRLMKEAINAGESLHERTANLLWPGGWTKAMYKRAKGAGLGKIYGGGLATLAKQTGAPVEELRELLQSYDEIYPEIKVFGRKLQREARFGAGGITTAFGRFMPLDKDRTYAAINYACQSVARDLLAQALLRLEKEGLVDHILLPVHDELVAQADEKEAPEVIREIGRVMESDFMGVRIESDTEIAGHSWGGAYGAPV